VTNAIIHASAKHVLINIEAQGPEVVFRVTNEGKPIPPDRQDSIFYPFVHTDASQSTSAQGLGLGLYIVKEIVTEHGGTVKLKGAGVILIEVERGRDLAQRARDPAGYPQLPSGFKASGCVATLKMLTEEFPRGTGR
jgi:signal transduction histidine kinase